MSEKKRERETEGQIKRDEKYIYFSEITSCRIKIITINTPHEMKRDRKCLYVLTNIEGDREAEKH